MHQFFQARDSHSLRYLDCNLALRNRHYTEFLYRNNKYSDFLCQFYWDM